MIGIPIIPLVPLWSNSEESPFISITSVSNENTQFLDQNTLQIKVPDSGKVFKPTKFEVRNHKPNENFKYKNFKDYLFWFNFNLDDIEELQLEFISIEGCSVENLNMNSKTYVLYFPLIVPVAYDSFPKYKIDKLIREVESYK